MPDVTSGFRIAEFLRGEEGMGEMTRSQVDAGASTAYLRDTQW